MGYDPIRLRKKVDQEIAYMKKRQKEGEVEEDTALYKLKLSNLQRMKDILNDKKKAKEKEKYQIENRTD